MIHYKSGDMFQSGALAYVNPVNCVGVMGKGLALDFKKRYPKNFLHYQYVCEREELFPGNLFIYKENGNLIINFATKKHWRNPSKIEYIINGCMQLRGLLESISKGTFHIDCDGASNEVKVNYIAMPAIGCGLGGLSWDEVKNIIENTLNDAPIDIYLYPPMEAGKEVEKVKPKVDVDMYYFLYMLTRLQNPDLEHINHCIRLFEDLRCLNSARMNNVDKLLQEIEDYKRYYNIPTGGEFQSKEYKDSNLTVSDAVYKELVERGMKAIVSTYQEELVAAVHFTNRNMDW